MIIKDNEYLQRFFKTAEERQVIYAKKEAGEPKPWTSSLIFQRYYFCNVFREQDKTSKFIIKIMNKFRNDKDNWKRIIIARYFSRLDVLQDLEENGELDSIELMQRGIERRVKYGLPLHTRGFLVGRTSKELSIPKYLQPFYLVKELEKCYDKTISVLTGDSLKEAWKFLNGRIGTGSFFAYQYVCDFAYDEQYLFKAKDHDTFTAVGPGSFRGMNRILTGSPTEYLYVDFIEFCKELLTLWREYVSNSKVIRESKYPEMKRFYSLHLCNVQHWLCEFDKYERGGSSKRKYNGGIE